jgi:acyl carrier protein
VTREIARRILMMDDVAVRMKLRNFITRELIRDEDYELNDTEGIITEGLMDSFALAEFAVYVEQEFDVFIPDSDLTVEKMDTLDQMVARVMRDLD